MNREPHIPLFLWIATAVLVHLLWGGGAQQVSRLIDEQLDVERFVRSVSSRVRLAHQPFEVTLEEEEQKPTPEESPPSDDTTDEVDPELANPAELDEPDPNKPKDEAVEKAAEKTEAKKEEQKKAEEVVVPLQPLEAKRIEVPKRIAVEQNVKDKNQAPNPDAEFIADQANHAQEQTQAKITSTEQNDPAPNPGTSHSGPSSEPGNAQVDEVAQAEDRPGNPDRAPGETSKGDQEYSAAPEPPQTGERVARAEPSRDAARQGGGARGKAAEPEQQEQAASRAVQPAPDLATASSNRDQVSEAAEARAEQKGQPTRKKRRLPPTPGSSSPLNLLGLGSGGISPNGLNLNLSHSAALATVGRDQLAKQILADGERRRSAHRGSWRSSGLDRWRSAIENYVPHVKPGNQTALNTALVPFAAYLNRIHNRLHPIFAEQFLAHLDEMPKGSPFDRMDMHTNLEIVLKSSDGSIVDMGVTRLSGVTAFDVGALDSVSRASPFGTPPKAIVSPDGNVYLHWEFYRDPRYACSTYFAFPKMLRANPKGAPSTTPPSPNPFGPEESPILSGSEQREGNLRLLISPATSQQRLAAVDQSY